MNESPTPADRPAGDPRSPKRRKRSRALIISRRFLRAMKHRLIALALSKDSKPSEATSAFRALMAFTRRKGKKSRESQEAAERINAAQLTSALTQYRQQMQSDEAYLDFLRRRALDADAGPVRAEGEPRPLENGRSPDAP